jgi:hypothetical protein
MGPENQIAIFTNMALTIMIKFQWFDEIISLNKYS